MKNNLKKRGLDTMTSKKIDALSDADLNFLEKLLSKEFSKQCEYTSQFKSKNQYVPGDDTKQISRLLDAVRSQKKINNMPKW